MARAVRAQLLRATSGGAVVRVALLEGRHREVRRMMVAIGCNVEHLLRLRVGPQTLGDLKPGEYRVLRSREVQALREAVGLEA